ncbi:sulfatase-like hydrolase/transferase [Flavobacterium sp.]|uniref:LTA synthase family protein n=1 Tax=Flavobacterium sp. TaxID=239 RepID=UPI00286DEF91|nr:sulfatase-like hydrolase/transferase [Flavobacterium sp.]
MKDTIRFSEYKVLFFRLLLVYVFYFIARLGFWLYNYDALQVDSFFEFLRLAYHGLVFDTTSILYINSLFILLSVLPLVINTRIGFQKILIYLYFATNLLAYATNFADFIYYRHTYTRTTTAVLDVLANESNKSDLMSQFLIDFWHVFVLFFLVSFLWIYLYKRVKVVYNKPAITGKYFLFSTLLFLAITTLAIGGIRGDFKKSTRPLNLIDANRYIKNIVHADIVLNTPFAIIRTLKTVSFKRQNFVSQQSIDSTFVPIKKYNNNKPNKQNIVIFILESYGREYVGSFNKGLEIPNYKGYTPFIDSLAQHSMIYTNAYCNGSKSIHGMSSILAGIPSFKDAFTSSPFANQKIESLVSTLKSDGYDTSFFHGAPNGSMGFLGFGNILGFNHYYGKTEFNNDKEHDGFWGIWDEPFFQYMKSTLDAKKQPFMATLFSLSSHNPYIVPEKYKGKFPKGNLEIHQCVAYTDYSLKQFFKQAKKEKWYDNTIFVMVADHGNYVYYEEFMKPINRFAVPILIFKPNSNLKGVDTNFAQQIDIYPTILDMIGYQKPFRSWGRSLLGDKQVKPFAINHSGSVYQFMQGNYICTFDGKQAVGFFDKNDKGLTKNLIQNRNQEMNAVEIACKAFLQNYMNSIIDKKLAPN